MKREWFPGCFYTAGVLFFLWFVESFLVRILLLLQGPCCETLEE